jgi:allantoate deiminase
MSVRAERIRADIEAIARCTATPGNGATRPTFSQAWAEARTYVISQAQSANCDVRTDAAGNVHARPKSLGWNAPTWMVGSHIDSVPHGGDYDGVAGVVVGLELLRSGHEDGVPNLPVELIVFAEEEGPTFGLGMIGSRVWAGELTEERLLELRNADGQNYLEAGKPYGVDAGALAPGWRPNGYLGLIEVHIEQGPGMWRRNQRLAIVRTIAGRRQYRVTVLGEANHAGATSMSDRRDALAAAAGMIVEIRRLARELANDCVATVGRLDVRPNAVNVIPDRVDFTIDFRAPADTLLIAGDAEIQKIVEATAAAHGVKAEAVVTESIVARPMDGRLGERLERCAKVAGFTDVPLVVSGALHDSAVMAPHLPTAMLFIPSRDGISHNPAEFSRIEDISAAAGVVERLVRRPTLRQLNAMPREAFVAAVGHCFEHSPWIAERGAGGRPFASLSDLHEKLIGVVRGATPEEQLGLIRAHPDLVGRLAREGRLTRESSAEQSAAGLTALSTEEVDAFERHNAAYREKFGFPFVICARENRKEAILAAFPRRLKNSREQEIATALDEIYKIARLRLADAVWED